MTMYPLFSVVQSCLLVNLVAGANVDPRRKFFLLRPQQSNNEEDFRITGMFSKNKAGKGKV